MCLFAWATQGGLGVCSIDSHLPRSSSSLASSLSNKVIWTYCPTSACMIAWTHKNWIGFCRCTGFFDDFFLFAFGNRCFRCIIFVHLLQWVMLNRFQNSPNGRGDWAKLHRLGNNKIGWMHVLKLDEWTLLYRTFADETSVSEFLSQKQMHRKKGHCRKFARCAQFYTLGGK